MTQQHLRLITLAKRSRLGRRARHLTNFSRSTVIAGMLAFAGAVTGTAVTAASDEIATAAAAPGAVGTVVVNVVGVGAQSGTVVGLLFNRNDGFPAKIAKACQLASSKVAGNVVTLRFADVPLGTYAVTVYHDVNDNQKLDTNWVGIPKEPVAISNNAKGRIGPPKWKDASFELREATKELTVSLVKI